MSSNTQGFDSAKLQDRNWKGEDVKFDKNMAKKPSDNNRKCTDALCCIIFAVFLGAMATCTLYGYIKGAPGKLIAPVAADNTICGYGVNEGFPYLYIQDVTQAMAPGEDLFSYGVCVDSCPSAENLNVECNPACSSTNEFYPTYYLFDYCAFTKEDLPAAAQENWEDVTSSFENSTTGSAAMDVYGARWTIALSPLFAVIFTFGYIYFMDKCAYWLSWISVGLIQIMLIGTGIGCYFYRKDLISGMTDEQVSANTTAYTLNWVIWLSWIAAAFYYLMIACCFKSLRVAIAVIETAADFFADTKRVIFVPVAFFIAGIVFTIGWTAAIFCVASIGEITAESALTQTKDIQWADSTYYMFYFMIFGIVWLLAFTIAMNEFVIIVSAVTWYYSDKTVEDDDGIPGDSDVWFGFKWGFKYHMGSMALGSFALACIWVIRAIMEYVGNKVAEATGDNGCTKCLVSCIKCCVACFDRFIRFLNRNAYIYIAITSESFCSAALDAFIMILKNSAKFAFIDGIADVFMFLAKFLISSLTTFTCYWLLDAMTEVESPFLPLLVIFMLTWVIAAVFIAIFDTGSNTILQCYLLDKQISEQEGLADPDHIPPTMTKFFQSDHVQGMMSKHGSSDGTTEPLIGNNMA